MNDVSTVALFPENVCMTHFHPIAVDDDDDGDDFDILILIMWILRY